MEFMDNVIASIKERDHKCFMVPADHEISDAIFDQMDA